MSESELSRRDFFKFGGATAAGVGAAALGVLPSDAQAKTDSGRATLNYPNRLVGKSATMQTHKIIMFNYPDQASPCAAVKLGKAAPGGVGPDSDIVAYSIMCPHMGCPVVYNGDGVFKCGCHYSQFDAEKQGQMICGQATESLPRVELTYDASKDAVSAVGIDGLLYGRQANVL